MRSIEDLAKKESPYRRKMKVCKSYGGGLDTHKAYTLPRAIISKKRGSAASLSLLSRRGSFVNSCRPPMIPVQKNLWLTCQYCKLWFKTISVKVVASFYTLELIDHDPCFSSKIFCEIPPHFGWEREREGEIVLRKILWVLDFNHFHLMFDCFINIHYLEVQKWL